MTMRKGQIMIVLVEGLVVVGLETILLEDSVLDRVRDSKEGLDSLGEEGVVFSGNTTPMWIPRNCSDKYLESSQEPDRV